MLTKKSMLDHQISILLIIKADIHQECSGGLVASYTHNIGYKHSSFIGIGSK